MTQVLTRQTARLRFRLSASDMELVGVSETSLYTNTIGTIVSTTDDESAN